MLRSANRLDVDRDVDAVLPAAEDDPLDRADVVEIPAPGNDDVLVGRDDVIRGVEIEPTEPWREERKPGVRGVSADEPPVPPRGGFFLQGFFVLLSNPKVLVFFGAFIPQFMDMNKNHLSQVTLLGVTFMVIAGLTDATYALLAGRARLFFSKRRTRLLSRISGSFMIGGGIWLALTRSR